MASYHIGKLIEEERKKREVTQKQLALGIFSQQMLHKLEINECESDKLQVDILLQRLGRSPDKLEVFMSMTEYRKIRARDLIEELILKKKVNKAEYLLENYKAYYGEHNNVHMMFYNRSKAYLILQTSGNLDEALKYIVEAIELTIPGWRNRKISEYLVSTYEMENLLLYNKIIYMMGRVGEAQRFLDECADYIDKHYTDTEEFAKIYPKCVWLLSKVYGAMEYNERIVELGEKALDILRREGIAYFAIPVMDEVIWRYKRMENSDRVTYWQRFYNTFAELYAEYAPELCLDSLFFNVCQREYHLDYETIKGQRVSKGYTQEDVIDGVFTSARPLSFIENNKKNISRQHFEQLMGNMGLDKGKSNGLVVTDSFDVLQKKNILDYFGSIFDYEAVEQTLNELETLLDMHVADNRRFIELNRIISVRGRGRIGAEKALEKCKRLLAETYNIGSDYNRPPMRNEAMIINQIGICLGELGKDEEKIYLLNKVKKYYENSKMDIRYSVRSYLLLNINYVIARYENGNLKEARDLSKKNIELVLSYAKTRTLSYCCEVIAYSSLNNEQMKEECKTYLKKAYILHEFNYEQASCNIIEAYYKEWFDEEILTMNAK